MPVSTMEGSQKWAPRKSQVKRVLSASSQVKMESGQWSRGAEMNFRVLPPRSRGSPFFTTWQGKVSLAMEVRNFLAEAEQSTVRLGQRSSRARTPPEWSGSVWFMMR